MPTRNRVIRTLIALSLFGIATFGCRSSQEVVSIDKQENVFGYPKVFSIQGGQDNLRYVSVDAVSRNVLGLYGIPGNRLSQVAMLTSSSLRLVNFDENTFYPVKFSYLSDTHNFSIAILGVDKINNTIDLLIENSLTGKNYGKRTVKISAASIGKFSDLEAFYLNGTKMGRSSSTACLLTNLALRAIKVAACILEFERAAIIIELAQPELVPLFLIIFAVTCNGQTDPITAECQDADPAQANPVLNCLGGIIVARRFDSGCKNAIADYLAKKINPAHSTADPHFLTLDGLNYDFQGHGEFIATKSTVDNFEIQVRQEDVYKNGRATFNTAIAIQTGGDLICATVKPNRLFINKQLQDFSSFTSVELKEGASVSKKKENGIDILSILTKNGDRVRVAFQAAEYLDFSLYAQENRKGKVIGLLGNFDADKTNDIVVRGGGNILKNGGITFENLYPAYADSWRITGSSSLFYYDSGQTTESFSQKDFPRTPQTLTADQKKKAEAVCRAAGVTTEPYLSNCIVDVALTNNPALVASALWVQQNDDRSGNLPVSVTPPSNQGTTIDFNDLKQIELKTDAKIVNGCIRLNTASNFVVGAAYYKSVLTGDFESEFTFKISEKASGGADGFVFLISKAIPELVSGGGLGYQGTKSSVAIEFDTWQNTDFGDTNDNHISIHTNGQEANNPNETYSIGSNDKIADLSDGKVHTVKVVYQGNLLTVYLDGLSAVKAPINLTSKLGLTGSFYIGFTAATGGASEIHDICSWSFKNL